MQTIVLGEITVSVLNVGDFTWMLTEKLNAPEGEWRSHNEEVFFGHPLLFPTQSVHLALAAASIMVDPGRQDHPADPSLVPLDYRQPPDLPTQLLESGICPEAITHVVITHAHLDHYANVTVAHDGHDVPRFPNARCYLSLAEWERPEIQQALQDAASSESRTLGVLHQKGLLKLVEEDIDLLPGVRIVAAPGETPCHQMVRVHSQGKTLYCLGDLYHHQVEVEHPSWMAHWKNRESTLLSRHALTQAALAENAFLVAAHMPLGFFERTASGVKWVAREPSR